MHNIFTDLNLNQNELKESVIENLSAFPANARKGQIFFHTTFGVLFICKDDTIATNVITAWDILNNKTIITTISTTNTEDVDSIPISDYRVVKWIVSITYATGTKYTTFEILAIHDGSTVNYSFYSELGDTINYSISSVIESSNLKLKVTNNESNDIVVNVLRFRVS